MSIRMIIILVAGLLLVLFATQNTEPIGVHFFSWQIAAPASVAVFVAFAGGVLVGALLLWTDQRRARKRQPPTSPATTTPAKTQKNWWW
jgi:uncharacterized integral membrane protein